MIDLFSDSSDQSTNKYDSDDELSSNGNYKTFMLKDFRILSYDGNFTKTTAVHGSFYLFFVYCTS